MWTTPAEEFSEESETITASVPVSFLTWMVAIPSSTSGLDNEEGIDKEEVSYVFLGFSPFVCFTQRSPSAGMQQDEDCWGLRVVRSSGRWQGRASPDQACPTTPARQQGRPRGRQVHPRAHITGQVHSDDTGPKSNCRGNV